AYTETQRDVLTSKFGLTYEIIPKLKASVVAMRNSRNDVFYNRIDDNMLFSPAYFGTSSNKLVEDNIQGMLSYDKRFGDFSVVANVGFNYRKNTRDFLSMNTSGGLSVPGLYNISASNDPYIASNFLGESK